MKKFFTFSVAKNHFSRQKNQFLCRKKQFFDKTFSKNFHFWKNFYKIFCKNKFFGWKIRAKVCSKKHFRQVKRIFMRKFFTASCKIFVFDQSKPAPESLERSSKPPCSRRLPESSKLSSAGLIPNPGYGSVRRPTTHYLHALQFLGCPDQVALVTLRARHSKSHPDLIERVFLISLLMRAKRSSQHKKCSSQLFFEEHNFSESHKFHFITLLLPAKSVVPISS